MPCHAMPCHAISRCVVCVQGYDLSFLITNTIMDESVGSPARAWRLMSPALRPRRLLCGSWSRLRWLRLLTRRTCLHPPLHIGCCPAGAPLRLVPGLAQFKFKLVGFIVEFMQNIDSEISAMKLGINTRARVVADCFLKPFAGQRL